MELTLNTLNSAETLNTTIDALSPTLATVTVSLDAPSISTTLDNIKSLEASEVDLVNLGVVGLGLGLVAVAGYNVHKGESIKNPKNIAMSVAGVTAATYGIYKLIK